MTKPAKYLIISLPASITPSGSKEDALDAITATVSPESASVTSFPIPEFKIGTLDALVQQADELAKLEATCQAVVAKIGDALGNVLDGDEAKIENMKTVNDSMSVPCSACMQDCLFFSDLKQTEPVDQYLRTFSWNKVKYRADRSLGELMDLLEKVRGGNLKPGSLIQLGF